MDIGSIRDELSMKDQLTEYLSDYNEKLLAKSINVFTPKIDNKTEIFQTKSAETKQMRDLLKLYNDQMA